MANHASAQKCARQTEKKTALNRQQKSHIKTQWKKVLAAIAAAELDLAIMLLATLDSLLARAARRGIVKRGHHSRVVSKLHLRIKAAQAR